MHVANGLLPIRLAKVMAVGSCLGEDDPEKLLLGFFGAQEGNPLFDPQFALRVCVERRSCQLRQAIGNRQSIGSLCI